MVPGKSLALAVILALALSLALSPEMRSQEPEPGTAETWTFMVYMSGDSDLSNEMPDDIREMKSVGSGDGLDIIVLADSSGVGDSTLSRILPNGKEDIPLTAINATWGNELNLGSPETLSQFVTWAAESYPADRLMLDLWGHGSGWGGVCPDKGDFLEATELRAAMRDISDAGTRLDIVSMDACQMGMLETAYELRWAADYAMLSQKDVPRSGWPYDLLLPHLRGNGTVTEKASAMIDAYISWGPGNTIYSLTLSLADLSEIEEVAQALDAYSAELELSLGFFNPDIIAARAATEKYDGNAQYDLVHLLRNINLETRCKNLEAASADVLAAMERCIVHENHWTNAVDEPADNAHGLSIWFPNHAPGTDYFDTGIGADTSWSLFLREMGGYFGSPGREEVPHMAGAASMDSDGDGTMDAIRISYEAHALGVSSAQIYGPDGKLFFGQTLDTSAPGSVDIGLENLGMYQAAIYLRGDDGVLLNYTLIDGLAREGVSVISGRVTSEIGRGLKWVNVDLIGSDGATVASTMTDGSGRYRLEVRVPTETNGTGLTLVCGLGDRKLNATIEYLGEASVIDFTFETASQHVEAIIMASAALVLLGIAALICWAAIIRRDARSAGQNLLSGPPITPQCDSTPTSTSTDDTRPPQAPT